MFMVIMIGRGVLSKVFTADERMIRITDSFTIYRIYVSVKQELSIRLMDRLVMNASAMP